MIKHVTLALVITAVAIPAAAPSTAAAQTCEFSGLSGQLSPPIRPIPFFGDFGSYNASGSTTCVGGSSGDFTSDGSYESTLCGSGTWRGHWSGTVSFTYRVEFTGGHGLMYIPGTAPVPSGYMHITPENRNPPLDVGCTTAPVQQFEIWGVFRL